MDRYETVSQLSSDVLGDVHLADDTMLKRQVVMRHIACPEDDDTKSSDQSWRKEFPQYAGKLGSLRHPNIPTIYDLTCKDDGAYVVSQYLEGETLAERLEKGMLSQEGVHTLAADLLDVLHAAHESGVFHGGLNTGSILRIYRASGGYRNILTDLGLTKLVSMVKGEKLKIVDPVILAPELSEKGSEPNAKADLFMVGQICYTALIGGHPFSGMTEQACVEAYNNNELPPLDEFLDGMPPAFSAWITKMVEVDPVKRFENAAEAMVALHQIDLNAFQADVAGVTASQNLPSLSTNKEVSDDAMAGVQREVTNEPLLNSGMQDILSLEEETENKTIMYVIGGFAALLVLALTIFALRGGEDLSAVGEVIEETSETPEQNLESSEPREIDVKPISLSAPSSAAIQPAGDQKKNVTVSNDDIQIGKARMINTVSSQRNPVIVDLDMEGIVDWLVMANTPSSKRLKSNSKGSHVVGLDMFASGGEVKLEQNPIRFKVGGETVFPGACLRSSVGSHVGAGYEVSILASDEMTKSLSIALYALQKRCGIEIMVKDPSGKLVAQEEVPYSRDGIVKVPITIDNPQIGDAYKVSVRVSSAPMANGFTFGFSGLSVQES